MGLNLRQIEVFRAIMVSGSISGAARMLAVSQPAVSRMLLYMEDRLHLKLFERRAGRVVPTPEARRIFDEVEQLHQNILRVNEIAEELRFRGVDQLRIACSPSIGQSLIPMAIALFRQRFADLRLEMEILSRMELIEKVGTGRIDLGVSVLPVAEPMVQSSPIAEGRLMVICPQGHPLLARSALTVQDLQGEPMIGFGAHTPYGHVVQQSLPGLPTARTLVRFVPNACALVQAGVGLAIVDEFALGGGLEGIGARPLKPEVTVTMHQIVSSFGVLSAAAKHFSQCLKETASRACVQD